MARLKDIYRTAVKKSATLNCHKDILRTNERTDDGGFRYN